jgi:hypothetical protein
MSSTSPSDHDEEALSPEEEDELLRRCAESEEAEERGELIPWEALFPLRRLDP